MDCREGIGWGGVGSVLACARYKQLSLFICARSICAYLTILCVSLLSKLTRSATWWGLLFCIIVNFETKLKNQFNRLETLRELETNCVNNVENAKRKNRFHVFSNKFTANVKTFLRFQFCRIVFTYWKRCYKTLTTTWSELVWTRTWRSETLNETGEQFIRDFIFWRQRWLDGTFKRLPFNIFYVVTVWAEGFVNLN